MTSFLAPGEVATVGILAVDKGQARTIFRFVHGLLKAVPMLERLIVRRDGDDRAEQSGGDRDRHRELSLDARLQPCRGAG